MCAIFRRVVSSRAGRKVISMARVPGQDGSIFEDFDLFAAFA